MEITPPIGDYCVEHAAELNGQELFVLVSALTLHVDYRGEEVDVRLPALRSYSDELADRYAQFGCAKITMDYTSHAFVTESVIALNSYSRAIERMPAPPVSVEVDIFATFAQTEDSAAAMLAKRFKRVRNRDERAQSTMRRICDTLITGFVELDDHLQVDHDFREELHFHRLDIERIEKEM